MGKKLFCYPKKSEKMKGWGILFNMENHQKMHDFDNGRH